MLTADVFRPIAHLPCPTKATLAVRCCPVYFELRTKKGEGENSCVIIYQSRRTAQLLFTCSQALFNLYRLQFLFFLRFCLHRWFCWDSPQCLPLAIPHGVCCGIWGLHFIIWHAADSSLWPGGQHSLSHTEWPCMVRQRSLVSTLSFHVFLSFAGINQSNVSLSDFVRKLEPKQWR